MSLVALQIKDTDDKEYLAVFPQESQMANPGYIAQIPHLLFGNHELTNELLYKVVEPNVVFGDKSVISYIYICFFENPALVLKWIKDINSFVPKGWSIAWNGSYLEYRLGGMQVGKVFAARIGLAKTN